MRILVQKFGGTSLSTAQARKLAIQHIQHALSQNNRLVVVVSAMGRKGEAYATDSLLEWIEQNGNRLSMREKDMLLCCGEIISAATISSLLNAKGISAVFLTGPQAGIVTDDNFGNAHILSIEPSRILHHLDQGQVVVVAGFQGKTAHGDFTTLGRGGSDTSATALASALKAEMVDIFTDVDGIYTADPRIVEEAKTLTLVTYSEICNMAYQGAKVIHPRAVEIAMEANIPIRVRNTFSDEEGTLVTYGNAALDTGKVRDLFVTGIAHVSGVTQIQVNSGEGQYDTQLKVFKAMAQNHISVDFINVNPSGAVYTVFDHEADTALSILRHLHYEPKYLRHCAKISVIGGGINGVPGIMAQIVEALTEVDVQILQSADSNTTIWVLVHQEDMVRAVKALHQKFQLHKIS